LILTTKIKVFSWGEPRKIRRKKRKVFRMLWNRRVLLLRVVKNVINKENIIIVINNYNNNN